LSLVLPLILDHSLEPVCPGFEDPYHHLLVDSNENLTGRTQDALLALTIVLR
jgi:hypothetical protein